MNSTRLPGKVMKIIKGKTVLHHVLERVKCSKLVDEIILATTLNSSDDIIEYEAINYGVKFFRGSEQDVLSRYYLASKKFKLDLIVRITSDCPLIDPELIDKIILFYKKNNQYDLVTNSGPVDSERTYPRGYDISIFSFDALEEAFLKSKKEYQREHVTPYIYENLNTYILKWNLNYSHYRLTLDTAEDYELINIIYEYLYQPGMCFGVNEVVSLLKKEPSLLNINKNILQKKLK